MHELVRRFDTIVGDVRPDLVITHSANDLHWDHGLVNRATVSALRRTPCDLLAYLSSPEMNAQSRSIGKCFADIIDDDRHQARRDRAATSRSWPSSTSSRRATSRARWAGSAATSTPSATRSCACGSDARAAAHGVSVRTARSLSSLDGAPVALPVAPSRCQGPPITCSVGPRMRLRRARAAPSRVAFALARIGTIAFASETRGVTARRGGCVRFVHHRPATDHGQPRRTVSEKW